MAWTAPATFAVGDLTDAAFLNTYLTANLNFLYDPPRARATRGASQSISNETVTEISYTGQSYDTDGIFAPTSTDLIIVTAGRYAMCCTVEWEGDTTGYRTVSINHSLGGVLATDETVDPSVDGMGLLVSYTFPCQVGDVLTVLVYQNSGSSLNVNGASDYSPPFAIHWVGGS